jgi:hypothetical protein
MLSVRSQHSTTLFCNKYYAIMYKLQWGSVAILPPTPLPYNDFTAITLNNTMTYLYI